jgi:copper chaperone
MTTVTSTPKGYDRVMSERTYTVPGMHCGHCKAAVEREVSQLEGIDDVLVDLETKRVVVRGGRLDDAAIRAAIDDAGYEAA